MKRDLDIIRNILLYIENADNNRIRIYDISVNLNLPIDVIKYHIDLLADKKFIILRGCATVLSPDYKPYDAIQIVRMTFDGCDYLEAIKNDTIWNNVKKDLKRIGGSASLDIVKTLAVNIGLKILQE